MEEEYIDLGNLVKLSEKKTKINHFDSLTDIEDEFDVFLFDMHGVLHSGGEVSPEIKKKLKKIRESGKKVVIASNDTGSGSEYLKNIKKDKKLIQGEHFDFVVTSGDVFTNMIKSGEIRKEILENDTKKAKIFIMDDLKESLINLVFKEYSSCFERVYDINEADAVITGTPKIEKNRICIEKKDLVDEERKKNLEVIKKKRLTVIVPNPDTKTPNENGSQTIGAGRFGKICQKCGVKVIQTGKPSKYFYDYLKNLLRINKIDLEQNRIAMIGDSFATDIIGGNLAGFQTVAISNEKSNIGITKKKDEERDKKHFEERIKKEKMRPSVIITRI